MAQPQVTMATLIIDVHDTSIFLSGVMLLENEIKHFLGLTKEVREDSVPDCPSQKELEESLVLCQEKKKILEEILTQLEAANAGRG